MLPVITAKLLPEPCQLNMKLEQVLLHSTTACGPDPPSAEPRRLTGTALRMLASRPRLLPLLFYIHCKEVVYHSTELFRKGYI